jgi:hypothetical protein
MKKVLGLYLKWHYSDRVKAILRGWRDFLKFNFYYFSVPLLLKTLFSPWRKYRWAYGNALDFKVNVEVFLSNLISRALGAIVRSFLIIIGLATEAAILVFGIMAVFLWTTLPFLVLLVFAFGIRLLF